MGRQHSLQRRRNHEAEHRRAPGLIAKYHAHAIVAASPMATGAPRPGLTIVGWRASRPAVQNAGTTKTILPIKVML